MGTRDQPHLAGEGLQIVMQPAVAEPQEWVVTLTEVGSLNLTMQALILANGFKKNSMSLRYMAEIVMKVTLIILNKI